MLQRYLAWSNAHPQLVSRLLVSVKDASGVGEATAAVDGAAVRCLRVVEQGRGQGALSLDDLVGCLEAEAQRLGVQCNTDAETAPGQVTVLLSEELFYVEVVLAPRPGGQIHVQAVRVVYTDDAGTVQQQLV